MVSVLPTVRICRSMATRSDCGQGALGMRQVLMDSLTRMPTGVAPKCRLAASRTFTEFRARPVTLLILFSHGTSGEGTRRGRLGCLSVAPDTLGLFLLRQC